MAERETPSLRATLKSLVPKILEHRSRQIADEETKQWLIAPLLAALGWDAHDPAEVRYEYRANRQCNPVDYGLMVQGKTKLVIEAKGLGRDLDTGIAQLFGNLGVAGGVHWGVLTDGDQYRVYKVTGDGGASEKLFFELSISDEDETASRLLSLLSKSNMAHDPAPIDMEWRDRLLSNHVQIALQEMLDGTDKALIDSICGRHPEHPAGTVAAYLARLDVEFKDRGALPAEPTPANTVGTVSGTNDRPTTRERGYDVFCELLDKPIKREDLIAQMVAKGFTSSTASSYISWAKKAVVEMPDKPGYCLNPFFVEIEVYKDGMGTVWLRRKPGRDFRHELEADTDMKTWVGSG